MKSLCQKNMSSRLQSEGLDSIENTLYKGTEVYMAVVPAWVNTHCCGSLMLRFLSDTNATISIWFRRKIWVKKKKKKKQFSKVEERDMRLGRYMITR